MKSFNIILEIKKTTDVLQGFIYHNSKTAWIIESDIDSLHIEEHWDKIKNKINLLDTNLKNNTTIIIIIYDNHEEIPPIFIPPDILKFAVETQSNIKVINNKEFKRAKD